MPKQGLLPENKKQTIYDLDRLRLTTKGEKARLLILDEEMHMMVRHWIQTGPPDENGRAPGRYVQCKGNYDAFMADGSDPNNCPACAVANPDGAVSIPRRQFACNIAQYHTNAKGQPVTPISLVHKVWTFGDAKFNTLVDRAQEHGDLRKKDIVVTCVSTQYQNMDIDISPGAAFMKEEHAKSSYKEIRDDRPNDLDPLLASDVPIERLEQMIDAVREVVDDEPDVLDDADTIVGPDALAELDKEIGAEASTLEGGEAETPTPEVEAPQPAGTADFADLFDD